MQDHYIFQVLNIVRLLGVLAHVKGSLSLAAPKLYLFSCQPLRHLQLPGGDSAGDLPFSCQDHCQCNLDYNSRCCLARLRALKMFAATT